MVAEEALHVYNYLKELQLRASQKYGVDTENIHLGHAMLQALSEYPDHICQIDAVTGHQVTNKYLSERIIDLAKGLHEAGLRSGDVVMISAPPNLEMCVPLFTAIANGQTILPVHHTATYEEMQHFIELGQPKAVFCYSANEHIIRRNINELNITAHIVVIDDPNNNIEIFIQKNVDDVEIYKLPNFSLSTACALMGTSGTTGKPKVAILTHQNIWCSFPYNFTFFKTFPCSTESCFLISSIQWVSGLYTYIGAVLFNITRIQTTNPLTKNIFKEIFIKYKPTILITSPNKLCEVYKNCNMNSLEYLLVGGSPLIEELEVQFKLRFPTVKYLKGYGMTELFQLIFHIHETGPLSSIGKPFTDRFQYRIVNPEDGSLITKPHEIGELHVKDACKFTGYLNNDEETNKLFTSDGFLKTGDLVYKDDEDYHFVVDRLKMVLKYNNFQIYPQEIEKVLRRNKGVADAAVTGIPSDEGDLPVAIVVKKYDNVTAKELIDSVANCLSDYKQLRGGVLFIKELPLTITHKPDRKQLKEIALKGKREF